MSDRFHGKVALVTGAASGIGAATARRFAAEGAKVFLADVNEEGLASVAKEIGGDRAASYAADVSDLEQVQAMTDAAVEQYGRLDIVFNNAGIGTYGQAPDLDPEVWRRVMAVNVDSIYFGCRAAIPHLRNVGGGAIINTASISGTAGDYGLSVYNASKGAVLNFTRALAIDHARENIRVNAVCPGPIDTALAGPLIAHPVIKADYDRLIPMGRVGRADEVASVVAFLASDDAAYVTGVGLIVDGGLTAGTGQPNFTRIFEDSGAPAADEE